MSREVILTDEQAKKFYDQAVQEALALRQLAKGNTMEGGLLLRDADVWGDAACSIRMQHEAFKDYTPEPWEIAAEGKEAE